MVEPGRIHEGSETAMCADIDKRPEVKT
jgi:hypothetical protein